MTHQSRGSSHCIERSESDSRSSTDESRIRPFEWLTNAESLGSVLTTLFESKRNESEESETASSLGNRRALHMGSGSSTVGEYLVQGLDYAEVVNVDVDKPTLDRMQRRWETKCGNRDSRRDRLKFCHLDFSKDSLPFPSGHFDLVVDKSTLDCALCSDTASGGLLCETYRCLDPDHGVYVIVSFNHIDLLLPMLQDLPDAHWTVSHQVVYRQVEDLHGRGRATSIDPPREGLSYRIVDRPDNIENAETSALCDNDRRVVNVILCRRQQGACNETLELDIELVRDHINVTNDHWFQQQNPMLTRRRREELQEGFGRSLTNSMPLRQCYVVLFTEAEREHLSFCYFLQDWDAFLDEHPSIPNDEMTLDTAIAFLEAMQ